MENICTLYTAERIDTKVIHLINNFLDKPTVQIDNNQHGVIIRFTRDSVDDKASYQISMRWRELDSNADHDNSPLGDNLLGMKGFISQIQTDAPSAITHMHQLIDKTVCESAISCNDRNSSTVAALVNDIVGSMDAFIFCQTSSNIGQADYPHFLDSNLQLLLDVEGNSAVHPPEEQEHESDGQLYPDQVARKEMNIDYLNQLGIKTIQHLPVIESEHEVTIRSSEQIAARAVMLALTNLVAFSSISASQAFEIIEQYSLQAHVTPEEMKFLQNPTDELKNIMSWKCEAIWVLCWALNIVEDLGEADDMADLNTIDGELYPIQPGVDPNMFIKKDHMVRSAEEILDENDLYYRLNWACVDARLNGHEIDGANPGVVYERQYALNWLINYMGQEWDDVTCDT